MARGERRSKSGAKQGNKQIMVDKHQMKHTWSNQYLVGEGNKTVAFEAEVQQLDDWVRS